jgi:HK97 family phage prohead protease
MPDLFLPWEVQLAGDTVDQRTGRAFRGVAATVGATDDKRDYAFAPGAFDEAVKQARRGRWPVMLFQHGLASLFGGSIDDQMPVGAWTQMEVEGEGDAQRLSVAGQLAETARGNDLAALLRMQPRPAIDGLSIGFTPTRIRTNEKPKDGERRHTFVSVEIHEISLVTMPAMGAARVKSVQSAAITRRHLERVLVRDAGLSRSQALALVRGGFDALEALRDAGEGEAEQSAQVAALLRRNIALLKGNPGNV